MNDFYVNYIFSPGVLLRDDADVYIFFCLMLPNKYVICFFY